MPEHSAPYVEHHTHFLQRANAHLCSLWKELSEDPHPDTDFMVCLVQQNLAITDELWKRGEYSDTLNETHAESEARRVAAGMQLYSAS